MPIFSTSAVATVSASDYLGRIGLPADPGPTRGPDELRRIAAAHLATVPFENLHIHGGRPVRVDQEAVVARIVRDRRGGICYELNGALCWLLRDLGYAADLHAARVLTDPAAPGPPLGHVACVVTGPALPEPWLVDIGFGGDSLVGPLAELTAPAPGGLLASRDGRPAYLLEAEPRPLADFVAMAWWHSTSPESRFVRSLICSITTPEGRVTLADRRLRRTGPDGVRETRLDPRQTIEAYAEVFGIDLDELPVRLRTEPAPTRR